MLDSLQSSYLNLMSLTVTVIQFSTTEELLSIDELLDTSGENCMMLKQD